MDYGLIGEKLGHSYSKLIQEKLLDNYEFEIHPLEKDKLDAFMKAKDFKAINVTIPYKQDVIPYLDELDEASKKIKAVNTIVNDHGKLIGHNTDYYGFDYMLKHHHIEIKDKKVLVMGNGGASKAIQAVIKDHQAKQMLIVDIVLSEGVMCIEEVYENHPDVDVIVNTTPLGMFPKVNGCCVDMNHFKHLSACLDVVYNPFATEFALQAKAHGIKAVTGLEMLVAQAKYALEFFKNITISDSEIDRIYKEILMTTTNLVVSDINYAKAVAETLGKELIDLSNVTTDLEQKISEICTKTNAVIVCSKSNLSKKSIHDLKRNSFFIKNEQSMKEIADAYKQLITNL